MLAQQGADVFGLGKRGNVLRHVLYQQNAPIKQVFDIGRCGIAHFRQITFQIFTNRIALQEIVVQSKECESDHDDQRSGQKDLVAESEAFVHNVSVR
ncbi:hypothetical protein D3C75_1143070 [compost metagenome]